MSYYNRTQKQEQISKLCTLVNWCWALPRVKKNNGKLSYSNFSILLTTEPSNYWCVFSFLILARTSYSKYWRVKTFGIIFFSTNSMINVNTCSIQLNFWHKTTSIATPMSWNQQKIKFLTRQTMVLIWYKYIPQNTQKWQIFHATKNPNTIKYFYVTSRSHFF